MGKGSHTDRKFSDNNVTFSLNYNQAGLLSVYAQVPLVVNIEVWYAFLFSSPSAV